MTIATYLERRGELETYFDRTAVDAWAKLTSDAPVGRIRATVRAGRDEMRDTLLSWLPQNMSGARLLDAGCGTGALAIEAARRGAAWSRSTCRRRWFRSRASAFRRIWMPRRSNSGPATCSIRSLGNSISWSRWTR